jgi:hypothetical protein
MIGGSARSLPHLNPSQVLSVQHNPAIRIAIELSSLSCMPTYKCAQILLAWGFASPSTKPASLLCAAAPSIYHSRNPYITQQPTTNHQPPTTDTPPTNRQTSPQPAKTLWTNPGFPSKLFLLAATLTCVYLSLL